MYFSLLEQYATNIRNITFTQKRLIDVFIIFILARKRYKHKNKLQGSIIMSLYRFRTMYEFENVFREMLLREHNDISFYKYTRLS